VGRKAAGRGKSRASGRRGCGAALSDFSGPITGPRAPLTAKGPSPGMNHFGTGRTTDASRDARAPSGHERISKTCGARGVASSIISPLSIWERNALGWVFRPLCRREKPRLPEEWSPRRRPSHPAHSRSEREKSSGTSVLSEKNLPL